MKRPEEPWLANDVMKLFGMKSKTPLLNAEKAGRIPAAVRGEKSIRMWQTSDLPQIGVLYGFLPKPKDWEFQSLCVFTVKGGVTKSSTTYILARIFALNGFRVLVAGNDPQRSITGVVMDPLMKNRSLKELPKYKDIGSVIFEDVPLEKAIQKTDLPNLDFLPETTSLNEISTTMSSTVALAAFQGKEDEAPPRHTYYTEHLIPVVKAAGYDIFFYDNGPGLNALSENALYSADYWITPNSCDQGSYLVFEDNFNEVLKFSRRKNKEWKRIFLIPTLLENNNLSREILSTYQTKFVMYTTKSVIKRTVKVQEALSLGASPPEVFPGSEVSSEYADLATEIYEQMLVDQKGVAEHKGERDGH